MTHMQKLKVLHQSSDVLTERLANYIHTSWMIYVTKD